jgi:catechol 2,3-dioxygenase-like lactoylglutathione lyase family enzyme
MEQRISILTLGVSDLSKSVAFFERLGWRRSGKETQGIAFFQCGCVAVALYPRAALAEDVGVSPQGEGFAGFTIAYNARSKAETDAVLAQAKAAGAEIVKPAQDVFWGGYSGYFRDIDGHLWEVAWNPFVSFDESGALTLPEE